MKKFLLMFVMLLLVILISNGYAAIEEPTDIKQPGTQPQEVSNLESPNKCDNCHGGYDVSVEPAYNWRGSMMANAGRDPIFWATLAVAEQDFDGSGDLCIRCHSTAGWLGGRSTPTDGSALTASDADGVECDFCHKMTNPDNSELQGVQNSPFIANDGLDPATGYYGTGMASIWGGSEKLGPYADTVARHQFLPSNFHRSVDFCGTCHDVSNPAVGDLAHNNGAQATADAVAASGIPGDLVENKAAFNNFPFMYGIVERTFSEYKAGSLPQTPVADYLTLPGDLQAGALQAGYESAMATSPNGPNYEDGTTRYYSCQTCHLRPVTGFGCNKKGAPLRSDLPLHDMTGGNYWMADVIQYLDGQNKLLLGGGLTSVQQAALNDGKTRSLKQLSEAASLVVNGNTLKVINHTGHKLISGYPEGRRMWLHITWFDGNGQTVREDGAYGPVATITNPVDGLVYEVQSLKNLHDPNTKVYEAHYGLTQEWAQQLLDLGWDSSIAVSYDRESGAETATLGSVAEQASGTDHESFHFVLNNTVVDDNRIPPYGFNYDEARRRNVLPVPADQYAVGVPGPGSIYNYWDDFALTPPAGAVYATIELLYQPTSWEYIQFLWKANNGSNAFLANEGINMLDAWLHTGMAAPYVMASTTWGNAPTPAIPVMVANAVSTWSLSRKGEPIAPATEFKAGDGIGIEVVAVDESEAPLSGVQVFMEVIDQSGEVATSLQGFTDEQGLALLVWKTSRKLAAGSYTAVITNMLKNGYEYDPEGSIVTAAITIQ